MKNTEALTRKAKEKVMSTNGNLAGKKFLLIMGKGRAIWRTPSGNSFSANIVKLTKEVWEIEITEHLSPTERRKERSRQRGKKVLISQAIVDRLKKVSDVSSFAEDAEVYPSYIYSLLKGLRPSQKIGEITLEKLEGALQKRGL